MPNTVPSFDEESPARALKAAFQDDLGAPRQAEEQFLPDLKPTTIGRIALARASPEDWPRSQPKTRTKAATGRLASPKSEPFPSHERVRIGRPHPATGIGPARKRVGIGAASALACSSCYSTARRPC